MPHQRIATVATPDLDRAVAAIHATDADLIEIRLDALWPSVPDEATATDHLVALTEAADAAGRRLLATLRPKRQGGHYEGDEAVRIGLLLAAAKSGFQAVDLEGDLNEPKPLVDLLHDDVPQVILSDHRFPDTPSKAQGLIALQAMQDGGADLQKIAFPAGSFLDILRAFELNRTFVDVHGAPSAQPIGGGAMVRALLPLAGCAATYGHATGLPPAVSGQPALADIEAIWTRWGITAADLAEPRREWIAVVGDPVDHSLSPAIHNAALQAADRPERYGALTVPDSMGAVRLLFGVAGRIGLVGCGVTAPLKVHALDASEPDEHARAVGAANTVRFRNGHVESTNTDAIGLKRYLDAAPDGPVLVLGAGGAARAAIHAANLSGRPVTFTSRDPERAAKVADDLGATWVPWADRTAAGCAVIIQATSLGSHANDPPALDSLGDAQLVIEMVYASGATPLEQLAHANGVPSKSGVEVLLNQAADQYRFWIGEEPDRSAMEQAIP